MLMVYMLGIYRNILIKKYMHGIGLEQEYILTYDNDMTLQNKVTDKSD